MSEIIFGLYQTTDSLIIHNITTSKVLSIDKEYLSIHLQEMSYLNTFNKLGEWKALGILGILNLGMMEFLIYISSSTKVGNIGNKEIFEIKDINFLGLSNNIKISEDIISIFTEIRTILQQGFYYSHNFDLTNSLQNQKMIKIKNNYQYDTIKHADKNFLWNYELNSRFYDYDVDSDFMVNCICGYVGINANEKLNNDGINLNYILISRRSCVNAGVKLVKRGLDVNGHAANYVETEQILIVGENIFSFVQARGAPPVIFDNETIQNYLGEKNTSNNKSHKNKVNLCFEKHINNLLSDSYQLAFLINLMNLYKQNEQLATNLLEHVIKQKDYNNIKYVFFDYYNETNGNSLNLEKKQNGSKDNIVDILNDPVDNFLKKIEYILNIFKFFGIYFKKNQSQDRTRNISGENGGNNLQELRCNENRSQITCDQIGIIRTSCYDGLERTNILQMRIAWKMILTQLNEINIDTTSLLENIFNLDLEHIDGVTNQNFDIDNNTNITQTKSIGKAPGPIDMIILQNPLFDSFTISLDKLNLSPNKNLITHKKSLTHPFFNSFKKLWIENGKRISQQYEGSVGLSSASYDQDYIIKQNFKQRCIDIFLQKFQPAFHKRTWNVAGQNLNKDVSLLEFLKPKSLNKDIPDIYFIGLQEIVQLSANYVLISSNQTRVEYWRNTIKINLDKIDSYTLVKCLDLVGVLLLCFVKTPLREKIKNLDSLIIKTGMMGTLGNKGSCLFRFEFSSTSIAVSCGHLAAGSSSKNSRINELSDILSKHFPFYKEKSFREHDLMIIFGDLNFRIDLEYNTCLQFIKNKNLAHLAEYDQLNKVKNVNINFFDIEEGPLNFDPTYKFVIGTSEYDQKKKRVPSWCDRIIFNSNSNFKQIDYNSAEIFFSDHKPVYSLFNLSIIEESKEEKLKIINDIKQKISLGINPNLGNLKRVSGFVDFEKENNEKYFERNLDTHDRKRSSSVDRNNKSLYGSQISSDLIIFDEKEENDVMRFFK